MNTRDRLFAERKWKTLLPLFTVGSKARHRKGRLEDMNAAEECIDALQAPALVAYPDPDSHGCGWITSPIRSCGNQGLGTRLPLLNQMDQCTCYLKKSGGPPHQISAILPVLQKELGVHMAIWTIRQKPPH